MGNMIEEPDSIKYAELGSGAETGTHTLPDLHIMFEELQFNDVSPAEVGRLPCSSLHVLECLVKVPSGRKVGEREDSLGPRGVGGPAQWW